MKNPISLLRHVALAEAISYLILLGVAMPLKYVWHQPAAVKIFGSIHGGLFVLFCVALFLAWRVGRWPVSRAAMVFAVSFLPIVPFFVDRKMKLWAAEFAAPNE